MQNNKQNPLKEYEGKKASVFIKGSFFPLKGIVKIVDHKHISVVGITPKVVDASRVDYIEISELS